MAVPVLSCRKSIQEHGIVISILHKIESFVRARAPNQLTADRVATVEPAVIHITSNRLREKR